jgi:hypothetical protein
MYNMQIYSKPSVNWSQPAFPFIAHLALCSRPRLSRSFLRTGSDLVLLLQLSIIQVASRSREALKDEPTPLLAERNIRAQQALLPTISGTLNIFSYPYASLCPVLSASESILNDPCSPGKLLRRFSAPCVLPRVSSMLTITCTSFSPISALFLLFLPFSASSLCSYPNPLPPESSEPSQTPPRCLQKVSMKYRPGLAAWPERLQLLRVRLLEHAAQTFGDHGFLHPFQVPHPASASPQPFASSPKEQKSSQRIWRRKR